MSQADKILAEQMVIYAENTYQIYRSRLEPFAKNYGRRIAKKQFNKSLAIKGYANNLARDVYIQMWKAQTGSTRPPALSQATKNEFGRMMVERNMEWYKEIAKEIKSGKRDGWGNKK